MKSTTKYSIIIALAATGASILGLAYFIFNILLMLTGSVLIISAVSFGYTTFYKNGSSKSSNFAHEWTTFSP
jgi:hypothetical protein